MTAAPAPIRTARLTLRPLSADDDDALLRFRGDPDATRYLSHTALSPEENTTRVLKVLAASAASTPDWFNFGWVIELQATGEIIGDARTWNSDSPPVPGKIPADTARLGYILNPDHQGLGLGREAAAALVEWLFTARASRTVFAGVYEPNLPSSKLLERLGFRKDHYFTAAEDTAGKSLPSWRYRLDRPE
ncbi:GNAT family N-acetyltransferase [Arthrobacter sp. UKPF54-2]|uniref:GNAT family N-acetyltransferase n=1 Tax=Arthrobacter sp. UKPF54-2 TaxID=2600159 RepID=UPI0011B13267|nr:GNAT family N-acetyltransferase [Arthrobacter sp. UKPF54-2]QDY89362.1 GNAT family N-acetyltransferase [Arthrobacter sp. UKPF54-2]